MTIAVDLGRKATKQTNKKKQDSLAQPVLLGRQGDKVYSLVWVVCLIVWTILVKVAAPYDITFPWQVAYFNQSGLVGILHLRAPA